MKYRITCLTPTLVGDGTHLSPIDYMVLNEQVNVLDQRRIFRMLAKSPRLESYLAQVSRAERLKFAEWGGYTQNYSGRRIPLEHPSIAQSIEQARPEALHIPTFAAGVNGMFLPASAVRGALRTALAWSRWNERGTDKVLAAAAAAIRGDRPQRRLAQGVDTASPGIVLTDGRQIAGERKIFHLRTARLQDSLTWKDSLPSFVEMATPGTSFEGEVPRFENDRALRAAASWSGTLLDLHLAYARKAKLAALAASLEGLRFRAASAAGETCLLPVGWGTGFLAKTGISDTSTDAYRSILKALPLYARAIQTGLPFPKTRRVVHLSGQPATLPGWILLEINR